MSAIPSSLDANNFYIQDEEYSGRYSVNFSNIVNEDQATEVATKCTSDARMERLKALGAAVLGGGVALLLTEVFLIAIKINMIVAGILAFPLMIMILQYSKPLFIEAKDYWNYGDELYSQASNARLKAVALASAKA
ncbi:MAG: hypothetical protein KR126chlam3_00420 [Chlamydiae bacterium]|nr:hypothetical protein [Chlamydiota bacterium]